MPCNTENTVKCTHLRRSMSEQGAETKLIQCLMNNNYMNSMRNIQPI